MRFSNPSLAFAMGALRYLALPSSLALAGGSDDTCGLECQVVPRDPDLLKKCLKKQDFASETAFFYKHELPALVFRGDDDYDRARHTWVGDKFPAAVVYAKEVEDVQDALACARKAGFQVTARGRGHSYQGDGVIDGYVVIDMTNRCSLDDVEVDRDAKGHHLGGSRYIATAKFGAGCTNMVALAAVNEAFDQEEGAIALTGDCPSVGITGFVTGAGQGDATPYVGTAADVLHEIKMVKWDGEVITSNKHKNKDVFWATQGGGGGLGIITDITYKVVEAPTKKGASPKFTWILFGQDGGYLNAIMGRFWYKFQEWAYDNPTDSSKFGGHRSKFLCLADWEECLKLLAPVLDEPEIFDVFTSPSTVHFEDDLICVAPDCDEDAGVPPMGFEIREFDSYPEAMAWDKCIGALGGPAVMSWTQRSLDVCEDLGISSDKYCEQTDATFEGQFDLRADKCAKGTVIKAILDAAGNPFSFINHHGVLDEFVEEWKARPVDDTLTLPYPGLNHGRLEEKTLTVLSPIGGQFHLTHGHPMLVDAEDTAYPWRHTWFSSLILSLFNHENTAEAAETLNNALLEDKAYKGDPSKLMGFYNYFGSQNYPQWERLYFGSNWERLQKIKEEMDPMAIFTKPQTPYAPVDDLAKHGGTGKSKNGKKSKGKGKGTGKSKGGKHV